MSGFGDPLQRERRKRNRRQWWRRLCFWKLPEPFIALQSAEAVSGFFESRPALAPQCTDIPHSLPGRCWACQAEVDFEIAQPAEGAEVNWRESLKCPRCGLINRWRGCLHLFDVLREPIEQDRIYLTENFSPLCRELDSRFPLLVSSEYLPDAPLGELVRWHAGPVRNEDVTQLSFADRSFDAVLSLDVLEHVPDYRRALQEFHRVLDHGGHLILSVPFSGRHQTNVRAVVDDAGNIEHLMEPCYHGDPLSPDGVLAYYDFGVELLDELRRIGFRRCRAVCHSAPEWGYFGINVAFVGQRR
jgi:hypothetical protein